MTDRLNPGERLNHGERLTSLSGQFFLILQDDGNLVLYTSGGSPLFETGTTGASSEVLVMQGDGNLVIYGPGGSVIWALNRLRPAPPRIPGAWLVVQDDGNTVIYDSTGKPICASGTNSSFIFQEHAGHMFALPKGGGGVVKKLFESSETGGRRIDTDTCAGCHTYGQDPRHHGGEPPSDRGPRHEPGRPDGPVGDFNTDHDIGRTA